MATPAQLAANRANAKRSTGPVTEAGKRTASQNAVRHGLTATQMIVEGEDPAEFEALRADVLARLCPEGAWETTLAAAVAVAQWRHVRTLRIEAAWWTLRIKNEQYDGKLENIDLTADLAAGGCFTRPQVQSELHLIMRYVSSTERAFHRAVAAFERAKQTRPDNDASAPNITTETNEPNVTAETAAELDAAPPDPAPAAQFNAAPPSPQIGFVSQKSRAERRAEERARRKAEKRSRRQQFQLAA